MAEVTFSIIIPAYNAYHYLDECICSIMASIFKKYEVLQIWAAIFRRGIGKGY